MGFSVSERVIKLLCGKSIFEKGLAYYQTESVDIIEVEEYNDSIPDLPRSRYEAIVQGAIDYEVMVVIDIDGDVQAECNCPAYSHGGHSVNISRLCWSTLTPLKLAEIVQSLPELRTCPL